MADNGISQTLITLLVIGCLAFVSIRLFSDLSTSLAPSTTTSAAGMAASNYTSSVWNSVHLLSNVPYLIGALGLLAVVVLFGMYAGKGGLK